MRMCQMRFYYACQEIMFIGIGLSFYQVMLCAIAWSVTVLVAEVPSGALADSLGRRRSCIMGAVFFLASLLLLVMAPPALSFPVVLCSRVLDALAEAMFSGSDTAIM